MKGRIIMSINIKDDILSDEAFYRTTDETAKEKNLRYYLPFILYALAGFCFSQLDALGDMSPFTAAFLSAVKFENCFGVFIASSLGYFLSKPWQTALKYTLISALMCLIRLFAYRRMKESKLLSYISSFISVALVGVIYIAATDFNYISLFMVICESLLSLCASVFFTRSFRTPILRTPISTLNLKDSTSLVLSLCIFLMCMSGFSIEGLSPARIFSCLVLMFLSFYKGSSAGSIAGVCIGATLCIDPDFRHLFPCYALSGLVAGVFSPLGQIVSALSFGISYSVISLFQGTGSQVLISLIEVAIASASFMIVPTDWIHNLGDTLKKRGIAPDNPVYRQVSQNLISASESIYQVSDIIVKTGDKLDSIINPEVNKLFANLQQSVCVGCENKSRCWNKMFDSTASDILAICGIEKRSKGKLPLEKRCLRLPQLAEGIHDGSAEYANSMAVKMKIREMRKVLTDQFDTVGDFLKETADKIACSKIIDPAKSSALRGALQDTGIYTDALSYYTDTDGRVTIEISIIDKPFETDRKKLRHIIEFLSKRQFGEPHITVGDVKTTITYEEKYLYDLQFGACQKPLIKNSLCGDSVCFVSGMGGVKTALISDGMGTGARAAIDSTMTASILEKLIEGGFSAPGAIRAVNSAMIMKSTDESIATVDAVSVNLYSGVADFYKAGAAVSFIRSGDEIFVIRQESLPVGIIRSISPAHTGITLSAGDIILLVSDGVTAEDCGWINDELLSWSTNNMQDLACHIASLAKLRSNKDTRDDITVAAVKISYLKT